MFVLLVSVSYLSGPVTSSEFSFLSYEYFCIYVLDSIAFISNLFWLRGDLSTALDVLYGDYEFSASVLNSS